MRVLLQQCNEDNKVRLIDPNRWLDVLYYLEGCYDTAQRSARAAVQLSACANYQTSALRLLSGGAPYYK
jgi:hypothetical protein